MVLKQCFGCQQKKAVADHVIDQKPTHDVWRISFILLCIREKISQKCIKLKFFILNGFYGVLKPLMYLALQWINACGLVMIRGGD